MGFDLNHKAKLLSFAKKLISEKRLTSFFLKKMILPILIGGLIEIIDLLLETGKINEFFVLTSLNLWHLK